MSELVLDAELLDDADVSPSPELPVAAAAGKAPEPTEVLTGDDLSDDILEDAGPVAAQPVAADATDVLDVDDVMSAEPHEARATDTTDVLDVEDVMSAEPHEAQVADVLDVEDVMPAEPQETKVADVQSSDPQVAKATDATDVQSSDPQVPNATDVTDVLAAADVLSSDPQVARATDVADVLAAADVLSVKPLQAGAIEARDAHEAAGVLSVEPQESKATDVTDVLAAPDAVFAAPQGAQAVAVMSAGPEQAPPTQAKDAPADAVVVSAAPQEAPAAEAHLAQAPNVPDSFEAVAVMAAEPQTAQTTDATDILDVEDAVSAEPQKPQASDASTTSVVPQVAKSLDATDLMSAHAIPEAEPVWDAAPAASSTEVTRAPAQEPIPGTVAAKNDAPVETMEFEALPEAPLADEAAKPDASVIATQDAEADGLEFSLAGDSQKPSVSPEAESWQVAAAPKADAGLPVPESDVALVASPEAPRSSTPEASPEAGAEPIPLPKPRLVVPPPAPVRDRTPITLDLSTSSEEPMQLASTWEFVGWQGGGEGEGSVGHAPETPWADRVLDLDVPAAAPMASEDGVALASAWEFMQQPWQPQAAAQMDPAQALLAAASASTDTPADGPAVTAEQVLSALDTADSQGMVGKVLLAYSAGRFRRAFLLGDSFGLARVGRAWGPGCDRPEVSALKVDLDAPSLFTSAMNGPSPSVFSAPQAPQDEAIFSALCGESESHLLVFPLHSRGQPVAFFVAEHGPAPLEVAMLEELGRIADRAVEICTRLHRFP